MARLDDNVERDERREIVEEKRNTKQKNIRVPDALAQRLEKAQLESGYTATQLYLQALDEYLTRLGY